MSDVVTWGNPQAIVGTTGAREVPVLPLDNSRVLTLYMKIEGANQAGYACIAGVEPLNKSFSYMTGSKFANNMTAREDCMWACKFSETYFLVVYMDANNSNKLYAKLGTISGNTISFGGALELYDNTNAEITCSALTDELAVVAFNPRDYPNEGKGTAIVVTRSGSTLGCGIGYQFQTGRIYPWTLSPSIIPMSPSNFIVLYRDKYAGTYSTSFAKAGYVSGGALNIISYASENCFVTDDDSDNIIGHRLTGSYYFTYWDDDTDGGKVSINQWPTTFGTPVSLGAGNIAGIAASYQFSDKRSIVTYDRGGIDYCRIITHDLLDITVGDEQTGVSSTITDLCQPVNDDFVVVVGAMWEVSGEAGLVCGIVESLTLPTTLIHDGRITKIVGYLGSQNSLGYSPYVQQISLDGVGERIVSRQGDDKGWASDWIYRYNPETNTFQVGYVDDNGIFIVEYDYEI